MLNQYMDISECALQIGREKECIDLLLQAVSLKDMPYATAISAINRFELDKGQKERLKKVLSTRYDDVFRTIFDFDVSVRVMNS